MEKSTLHFDVLGTSFSVAADEDSAYLENLLNRYRIILENTRKSTGVDEPLKLAILTGFLLCDEIEKMKNQENRENLEAEQRTLNMIAQIDEIFPRE
ncbi:MAG: cell division protein ZapA [Treponema sp.]|jgi:cell division protein ZapA (FtsZ GTPase activity inhibitor)|nr:cell division protein ZapA [Treponema sp.]